MVRCEKYKSDVLNLNRVGVDPDRQTDRQTDRWMDRWTLAIARSNMIRCAQKITTAATTTATVLSTTDTVLSL